MSQSITGNPWLHLEYFLNSIVKGIEKDVMFREVSFKSILVDTSFLFLFGAHLNFVI